MLRTAPIALAATLLFAVTLSASIAEAFQSTSPDRALAWNPAHAGASATLARRAIIAGHPKEGQELATRAIGRDPINATAYSALALAAEGANRPRRARELMATAHAISRRDRITEMWLIREAIRVLDYETAIRHFDIAMRASTQGVAELMPLLVASTADPRMVAALTPVLARKPTWKSSFLMSSAIAGPNAANVAQLSRGRLNPRQADERAVISRLIQRLVGEGRYELAWSIYLEARPGTAGQAAAAVRDTEFTAGAGFPPFDWQLLEEPDLSALRETRRDGRTGFALTLIAEGGRGGEVARQLVRLPQGSHRLQFQAGAVQSRPADRPQLSLSCADGGEPFYRLRPSRSASRPQQVYGTFTVPRGCPWQVLSVSVGGSETPDEFPWIADIAIVHEGPTAATVDRDGP